MHKVKIINGDLDKIFPTCVSVDGNQIMAKSVYYSQSVDEVPRCDIEINALPDIEVLADVRFLFAPRTIQEASKVLRYSLLADATLYGAFCKSIESALKEASPNDSIEKVVKSIAGRIIIGEE